MHKEFKTINKEIHSICNKIMHTYTQKFQQIQKLKLTILDHSQALQREVLTLHKGKIILHLPYRIWIMLYYVLLWRLWEMRTTNKQETKKHFPFDFDENEACTFMSRKATSKFEDIILTKSPVWNLKMQMEFSIQNIMATIHS